MRIDINADLGEGHAGVSPPQDEALFALVSSANIACGYHAGDAVIMQRAVEAATTKGIAIGAHPGYPDLTGFGRRPMTCAPGEISAYVIHQVGALAAFCRSSGNTLRFVKPHGALYNTAAREPAVARAIARAVHAVDEGLLILALPGSEMLRQAESIGLRTAREGFCDRGYRDDGSLIPRTEPGALITDPATAAAQALQLAPTVDSLCVHSDTPGAAAILRAVREALIGAGYTIGPFAAPR
jgi:5-oxoprolinase (ATP-hydrolysing) subunit A